MANDSKPRKPMVLKLHGGRIRFDILFKNNKDGKGNDGNAAETCFESQTITIWTDRGTTLAERQLSLCHEILHVIIKYSNAVSLSTWLVEQFAQAEEDKPISTINSGLLLESMEEYICSGAESLILDFLENKEIIEWLQA